MMKAEATLSKHELGTPQLHSWAFRHLIVGVSKVDTLTTSISRYENRGMERRKTCGKPPSWQAMELAFKFPSSGKV